MASAFICARVGIDAPVSDNSAAYLGNWVKALKEDSKALVWAAGKAAKAADYILGLVPAKETENAV